MRFPLHFTRVKPAAAGKVTLGSETDPPTTPPQPGAMDNLLSCKVTSSSGLPVQQLVIGYKYTGAGVAIALPYEVWIWDEPTQCWYMLPTTAPSTLTPPNASGRGALTKRTPVVVGGDLAALGSNPQATVGGLDAWIFVKDPGAAPDGTYDFIVAPDLSSF